MAATIVSTPATGSSDWTRWITQQGLTDRGFMQVSLTNFATTAASLIGTGSIFELAGSIYSCTETAISLAAGTISAAVAVYYVAIPSAGGTTCTFTMDSVAPTWVDAKQAFYASAASTSRYLGGAYIGTAATYYTKWIYTPDMVYDYLLPVGETRPVQLFKKVIEIGDWDMNASASTSVAHGMTNWKNIRRTTIFIRNDTDGGLFDLNGTQALGGTNNGGLNGIDNTNINLTRMNTPGQFDSVDFDSTSYNRGWITIEYEA